MRAWGVLAACLVAATARAAGDLAYTHSLATGETAIVDTRPIAECRRATLPGALCLPAGELLGPRRQLPAERDLLWLLGTLGLDGNESVLVVGDTASGRDFVGGVLYLAGQRKVRILDRALSPRLAGVAGAAPGRERGLSRTAVYTRPMRDELWIVHEGELDAASGAAILAPDAYAAIIRFTRHIAAGGPQARVGWTLPAGRASP